MSKPHAILPAEWAPQERVILGWPHASTDWAYMLPQVSECFAAIVTAIAARARVLLVCPDASVPKAWLEGRCNMAKVNIVEMPTNDTWARDFGPLVTIAPDGSAVVNDFKFNGWGLKFPACHDNLITRNLIASGNYAANATYANRLNFVLEGGSIDIDDAGTLITTEECLLSPNRNGESSKSEIESYLKQSLGCDRVLWLKHGALQGDDTDSHVDTLARFLPGGIIAYTACDDPSDEHYADLKAMEAELQAFTDANGKPYTLLPLPIPRAIYDDDGLRLPATYANFLIINGAVLLPLYADEHYDAIAIQSLREALPAYEVVPIDCRALIQQHGSLHCVTMQSPI